MTCVNCGRALEAGARFCPACGTPVGEICAKCGAALPADARFCPACGEPVADFGVEPTGSSARLTRERKVATALFADIVGYTALNETLDPEIVERLTASTFERLKTEVARYEGLVEKYAGDAMLVLFGVPQTHEDDPERAIRAAFEMQSAMAGGLDGLQVRIGIESGEVLVDHERAATDRERMVTGDAVNTSARLQSLAGPGEIFVGPSAYATTRTVIDYEELGALPVKGKSQPLAAWRAVAVRSRRGGFRAPLGLESPLVAREPEMALLKESVRRVVAEGKPYLVTLIGDAGVGKSRLTWELEKYLDGLPESFVWRKGRSFAYGQTTLGALVEIVRADASIREDDPSAEAVRKLDERLDALPRRLDDEARDLLRGMLGLGEMPKIPPDELFGSLTRYVEALARVAPAVFVFEDVHWADESLLDFVESVARWAEGPILLLCLARQELLERRPRWAGGIRNSSTVVIEPLDAAANVRLVDGLVQGGMPDDLRSRIVELADGNPLFTEELVRMFIDRGWLRLVGDRWESAASIDSLDVPRSIQAVLAARLDALPQTEKLVAQDTAVIGRVFWNVVVAELGREPRNRVDETLRRLRVKELVIPREPSSFTGADEFGFRHALIRDVAYESLPKLDRADKHLAITAWAERELGEHSGEAAELVAAHYLAALRYREEFGATAEELRELRRRSYASVTQARDRAGLLHDKAAATRWARIALELAKSLDLDAMERTRAAERFLGLGTGHWQRDEAAAVGREALSLLESISDVTPEREELESLIRGRMAWILLGQGLAAEARAGLQSQLDRLESGPPSGARASLLARLGWLAWRVGPAESGRPYLERALAEARATGSRGPEAWALHDLGIVAGQPGDTDEASRLIRQSLELARELGDHELMVRAYVNLPAMVLDNGADWDEIAPFMEEGLALMRRASDHEGEGWLVWQQAGMHEMRGDYDKAIELSHLSVEIAERQGDVVTASIRRIGEAWLRAHVGQWPDLSAMIEAIDSVVAAEEQYQSWAAAFRALLLWRNDTDDAVAYLARVLPEMTSDFRRAALWSARIAYRTGSKELMDLALAREVGPGPVGEMVLEWITALGGDVESAPDRLSAVVAEADRLGYRNYGEMSRSDLALAVARAGRDATEAEREAKDFQARLGMQPLLGPLPESRWLNQGAGEKAAVRSHTSRA